MTKTANFALKLLSYEEAMNVFIMFFAVGVITSSLWLGPKGQDHKSHIWVYCCVNMGVDLGSYW